MRSPKSHVPSPWFWSFPPGLRTWDHGLETLKQQFQHQTEFPRRDQSTPQTGVRLAPANQVDHDPTDRRALVERANQETEEARLKE